MIFNGTTVAFSTKANVWKTRYSFTPSCYMTMDNDFLSSNRLSPMANDILYKHDVNSTHNSFYGGDSEASTIEVVSNQNPSAVKIFKALSLETDARVWGGSVYTNKTRDAYAFQEGALKPFVQKEGNQYVDMPRSSTNSSSNITFIGVVKVGDLAPSNLSDANDSWDIPLTTLPDVALPGGPSNVYFGDSLITPEVSGSVVNASDGYSPGPVILRFIGYKGSNNSIQVRLSADSVGLINQTMTAFSVNFGELTEIPVYIMTNPVLNGDNMRGPYAGIKLTSPNSSSAFELYSINVDYEKTKLDGSLG